MISHHSFSITEIINTRTYVDVQWNDGTMEKHLRTTTLEYLDIDLDEHLFVAGHYVVYQPSSDRDAWPPEGYGVVVEVCPKDRIAYVDWYEVDKNRTTTPLCAERASSMVCTKRRQMHPVTELFLHPTLHWIAPGRRCVSLCTHCRAPRAPDPNANNKELAACSILAQVRWFCEEM